MKTLLIGALMGIAAASQATVLWGAGGSIPDANTTGLSTSIVVPDGGTLNAVMFEGLTHTWVGDITITISGMGDIVRRIGTSSSNTVGDSSNFGGNYTFSNTATGNIWTEATLGSTSYVLRPGAYRASTTGGALVSLPASIGAGTYTMTVTDSAVSDTGTLTRWGIDYTPVPEPGTFIALGAGVVALVARRKK